MGAPALTSRGFVESDFRQVADFVHKCAAGSSVSTAFLSTPSLLW
jgi:glycine/serine hydroxymethyltransferase